MQRRELLVLAAAATTAALMACAQTPPPATPLDGTDWLLVELPGQALPAAAGTLQRPSLRIAGDPPRAMGATGINNFVGTADLGSGSALRFGPLATTRRAGSPEGMQLESAYLAALGSVRSYRTGPETLELVDADGRTVARFATPKGAAAGR
jgi:heat shock protein HslJ